ncbi:MAG: trehalose-6-phosphate synthase [Acidobacteriota bacterium]
MSSIVRFLVVLVLALAILVSAVSYIVQGTIRRWFERDVALRAEAVVSGAHDGIVSGWRNPDSEEMDRVLSRIARQERVLGIAACDCELRLAASSADFPADIDCRSIGPLVYTTDQGGEPGGHWHSYAGVRDLGSGRVHLSAIPVRDGAMTLGFVMLAHDLSYIQRREGVMRWFTVVSFGFLAVAASLLTLAVARMSWRGWTMEVRRFLRGGNTMPARREFQPIVRDLRDLVARIAAEADGDTVAGHWTAERLRHTLRKHLHGEKLVIVANREPYIHQRADDGAIQVQHPASGLVTALEPVMRACSGVWVAHGSGNADREMADARGRVRVPPGEESYTIHRVWLTPEEENGYYYGFANEGLWPLCHVAHTRPTFRSDDWTCYQSVNRRFTEAVCAEVDVDDPIVLVQDYHFALAPRMIRERLPRATILTFWHIPWMNAERFGICPWRTEVLHGLLGSSIVGFHTQQHCNNFLEAVDRYLEARIDREHHAVVQGGRGTLVRPYPISIEHPSRWALLSPPPAECRESVFAELGLGADALLGVGVDRLDYTKGIEERMLAVERLLERFPRFLGRFALVQLAAPSRTMIERYRELNESVERLAARINHRFANGAYRPIILLRRHHEPLTVFRYYRAADLCYVSSLHDGMNLVAKEFVSARDDERGVLVLSSFTGAARELTEALIVNPYDMEQASSALGDALAMPAEEQQERMRSMRLYLSEFNVYRWAGRMLVDAAHLRRHGRLTGRLVEPVRIVEESLP